jgi:hypothetical protein
MAPSPLRLTRRLFVFALVFAFFCAPALLWPPVQRVQRATLVQPHSQRELASFKKPTATVPRQTCETNQRWRYQCDSQKKNCVKDRRETFLECHSL